MKLALKTSMPPDASRPASGGEGFSLVEVALALGVFAFCFVGMLGLLPVGLDMFRTAMDVSASAQIFERIAADAELADFDALLATAEAAGSGDYLLLPTRYFDDQGEELATGAARDEAKYLATIRASRPGTADPAAHSADHPLALPSAGARPFDSRDLTALTVQVVASPGAGHALALDKSLKAAAAEGSADESPWLLSLADATRLRVRVLTRVVLVARNGHQPAKAAGR